MVGTPVAEHHAFAGHLGHLTQEQETILADFKDNLSGAGLYRPLNTLKASHDDTTLLRFLRARGWQLTAAQKQFHDTENWRRKHDVLNLYATFDSDEFERAKRFYPRWTGRRDKGYLSMSIA